MEPRTPHFQSQAVAMLAIATGAIGFGLIGQEFRVSMELLPTMKLVAGVYALACYLLLVRSVRNVLESDEVTGLEVSQGPLTNRLLAFSSWFPCSWSGSSMTRTAARHMK